MSIARKILMGSSGGKKSTYVDDVFSTYLYKGSSGSGSGPAQTITNGVDLAEEGGLVWLKSRTATNEHALTDTVTGAGKRLQSESNTSQSTSTESVSGFTNSGFTLPGGWNPMVNASNQDYVSWTFRKAKGFFDIVTYTGNGSNRTIAHNLGSVPGCIMVKCTSETREWATYHRGLYGSSGNVDNAGTAVIFLNTTEGGSHNNEYWNNTEPTSTHFSVGVQNNTNKNGATYVAYIFAGGESTAATARSVVCDGSGDYLSLGSSSDLAMGTGDFTIEGWYEINAKQNFGFFMNGPSGLSSTYGITVWNYTGGSYGLQFFANGSYQATGFTPPAGKWFHLALVRNSGTTSLYYNGELLKAAADTTNYTNTTFQIGGYDSSPYLMNGSVSNFRIVKGTAVYTSAFRVPTEPLTAIPNTVLLCCNDSSTTGSTVTPGTITANGDPTASTDSPFDDPEGFQFGEEGDQNIIKCGRYNAPGGTWDLHLGWEPQWILIKNSMISTQNWTLVDSVRGMIWDEVSQSTGYDRQLHPNTTATENGRNICDAIPNGVRISSAEDIVNGLTQNYIYIAIRRPDGYVGKPPEAGTDAFTMDTGNSSSAGPAFDSNFVVDSALLQQPASAGLDWRFSQRLTGTKSLATNTSAAETTESSNTSDYNDGYADSYTNVWQSWMWKRHAGFDVVNYKIPTSSGQKQIMHNLGREPEMIWLKYRDGSDDWLVYNKYLGGGTDPWDYFLALNKNDAQSNTYPNYWGTSSSDMNANYFTINQQYRYTGNHVMMLFASVDGISKVGSYDGTGSGLTITTGFSPRFVILKRIDATGNWYVLDTTRGWGAGNDKHIQLNETSAQSDFDFGAPTATGFTLTVHNGYNGSGGKYIYYAHA